jgi:hypothetical protein
MLPFINPPSRRDTAVRYQAMIATDFMTWFTAVHMYSLGNSVVSGYYSLSVSHTIHLVPWALHPNSLSTGASRGTGAVEPLCATPTAVVIFALDCLRTGCCFWERARLTKALHELRAVRTLACSPAAKVPRVQKHAVCLAHVREECVAETGICG